MRNATGDFSARGLAGDLRSDDGHSSSVPTAWPNVIPATLHLATQAAGAAAIIFPEPNLARRHAELSPADDRAVELDAGRRALYAQPWHERHAALVWAAAAVAAADAGTQNQGLRQSINFNYNWSHSASDNVNMFPQLGGKTSIDSNSVQAGYTVGYHK